MNYIESYNSWLNNPLVDDQTKQELLSIKDNDEEIKDRFYQTLAFGTAGLRGKLGAGTNRMNKYIVGKATQGIADFIKTQGPTYMAKGVVIAHDCRHFSKEFAQYVAEIMAANGIKAYLFEDLRPTPELSYAILQLKAACGINVTASHNPKEYNGYKVYWEDGAQVLSKVADPMTELIQKVDAFAGVKAIDLKQGVAQGLIEIIGQAMDDKYIELVKSLSIYDDKDLDKDVKVVYTPLNGCGAVPVQRVLRERGFKNIYVVKEQEQPDPDFTTVGYPNPEDPKAFAYAERLGKETDATILVATDPDSDRLAIEVKDENGKYIPFNGNQTGFILIKYIVEGLSKTNKLPENPALVKSIVTGDLGAIIAKDYGVKCFESLTGFKNICGRIPFLKANNYNYVFGYEESIGYAASSQVMDKDGVSAAMLLVEAAAFYQKQNKSLLDVREELYQQYGYFKEDQISLVLEGIAGSERIKRMMVNYRQDYIQDFAGIKVKEAIDFLHGYEDIPASNVLKFRLTDDSWYAVRPSGTEPKIKLYIYTSDKSEAKAVEKLELIKRLVLAKLNSIK